MFRHWKKCLFSFGLKNFRLFIRKVTKYWQKQAMSKIFNCSLLPKSYKSRETPGHVLILCPRSLVITLLQERKTYLDTYLFGSLSVVENLYEWFVVIHIYFQVLIEPESNFSLLPSSILLLSRKHKDSVTIFFFKTPNRPFKTHEENRKMTDQHWRG